MEEKNDTILCTSYRMYNLLLIKFGSSGLYCLLIKVDLVAKINCGRHFYYY